MELRQIRYLLEIVRGGGFTRAAETVGISQPSLSIAVQKLEDELGVTLLNRQERKITLTAEGRAFCERARKIEELVNEVVHEMEEFRGLERGEIRVGVPGMLGAHFFPPVVAEFRRCYPNVKISAYSEGAGTIQEMVESGELDVAIVAAGNFPGTIAFQPLLHEEMVACVAKKHPLAKRKSITLREMASEPLFLFSEGYFQRQYLMEEMSRAGVKPEIAFETNLVPLLKEVTAAGGGVATMLRMAVDGTDLAAVSFDPPLQVEAVVIWKKNAYLSRATRAFLDFMTQVASPKSEPPPDL